jgi:zinc protease
VIGWMHDIEGLTESDALAYHAIYYSPQNATVVAVGDFNAETVMSEIREAFGGIKNVGHPLPVTEVEPPQDGERRVTVRHAANLPAVQIAYHVPNYQTANDAFALEVAGEILGDGKSSRLYRDLVIDKRMVVSVGPDYEMTAFDPTLFQVAAEMRPGVKAEDVLTEIDSQIAALRDHPVTDTELNKAKNQEQAGFVYGQYSVFNEAMQLGLYQMLGSYKMLDQYIPKIQAVTANDIQRVAKKYLVVANRTVGILVPTGLLPHELGGGGIGGTVHHREVPGVEALAGDGSVR